MKLTRLVLSVALCVVAGPALAQQLRRFEEAQRLPGEGHEREAFAKYLSIPGGEYAAVRLARPKPKEFLPLAVAIVDDAGRMQDRPRAILVQGDLLLATGDGEGALECYRRVTGMIAAEPGTGWEQGLIPHDYYPVEPPQTEHLYAEALPFTLGPGSHRDSWLIRRFVALQAWQDAEKEFSRIWEIYRQNAGGEQYPGLGLEFAIDYAYFLKRQGRPEEALGTLLDPLLRVDMDRNPNLRQPDRWRWAIGPGYLAGVSRAEFIRIAYGAFKTAGKEEELVLALQNQIEKGQNSARRVLTRVRFHRGGIEDALALELAYIQAGGFDELSAAYRRGRVYEDCKKLVEAAAEYEVALALPYAPPDLPDRDEDAVQRQMASAVAQVRPNPDSPAGREAFKLQVLERLHRLYGALGQMDQALAVTLRQYEASPPLLADFGSLEQAARRFNAAGKEAGFAAWARRSIGTTKDAQGEANLRWLMGDHAAAANALADAARNESFRLHSLAQWKDRFRQAGGEQLRLLLNALVKANPDDAQSRLELLDLDDCLDGGEAISALEKLLESDAPPAFARGRGEYNRTKFRNYYDLAYRLMRLCEKAGQPGELRALGLRIAKGQKPFGAWQSTDQSQYQYRFGNDLPEDANACLSLLIEHGDEPTLEELGEALKAAPDQPARAQLARRRAGGWEPQAVPAVGWANLPPGVSALACNENVLSLACDDSYIYAGMPWGVAVYSHAGEPVTRIALQTAALDLLAQGGHLWVGTPVGLNRITVGSWDVAYLSLDRDIPERDRGPERQAFQNGVCGLALDGDVVWVGTRRNIQRLDTRSNALRVYSQEELGVSDHVDWDRFVVEGEYVWADGDVGCRRYDRKGDAWDPVAYGEKPVHLVALADGLLWGHVWLNDELRDRPCLIDRDTLEVKPILIDEATNVPDRQMNGPFVYFGTWQGRPVLGPQYPAYVYDAQIQKLRALPASEGQARPELDSDLPPGLQSGQPWRRPDGSVICYDSLTHKHKAFKEFPFGTGHWAMGRLPDGTTVLAGRRERCPRYQYPEEDWPEAYETWDEEGGLYLISPDRQVRRISSAVAADSLPGDEALSVVFAEANHWVCTNRGLAALSEEGGVLARFTRADGLCANRVVNGSPLGGRVYFATGWGDHGGGLAVYDPQTTVFTALLQSDGLATDKLASVGAENGKLKLLYDVEYMRFATADYRLYPPGIYDPESGQVTPGGEARIMRQSEAHKIMYPGREKEGRPMPYLGGFILSEHEHQGRKYLCGTRGLVVLRSHDAAVRPLEVQTLQPKLVLDPAILQLRAAAAMELNVAAPEDLARYLESDNPFVRAKAVAAMLRSRGDLDDAFLQHVIQASADQHSRVRSTAVYILTRCTKDEVVVPALQNRLADTDKYIRAVAAIDLARRGHMVDLKYLREVLEHEDYYGSFPFSADSSIGVEAGKERLYQAIAPHATADVFALLMEYPLPADNYEPRQKILAELGKSLREHPEAAEVLLRARQTEPDPWTQVRFAWAVLGYAGKPLLPVLHEALTSKDRVIRSNAACACGAVGDPAAVPHLIRALDLESGLSRASIVWALGEVKAREALPQLVKLYVDARNDERRRRGAGFRAAQSQAEIGAQYDTIASLESVSSGWDELTLSLQPAPVDPRRNEDLLEPAHILEAVRKIGPAVSQEFYRTLSAEEDAEARREAAMYLAEGGEQDIPKNLVVLENLLADTDVPVRMRASVSLLILGQDVGRQPITEWLDSPNEWEKSQILEQLLRVKRQGQLGFARARIESIAGDPALREGMRKLAQRVLKEVPAE